MHVKKKQIWYLFVLACFLIGFSFVGYRLYTRPLHKPQTFRSQETHLYTALDMPVCKVQANAVALATLVMEGKIAEKDSLFKSLNGSEKQDWDCAHFSGEYKIMKEGEVLKKGENIAQIIQITPTDTSGDPLPGFPESLFAPRAVDFKKGPNI